MSFDTSLNFNGDGVMAVMAVLVLVIWLVMLAFCVVSYVLLARGLQVIARRRGIRKPWLAWIPVVQAWTLGSISDQYQYVVKGKIRSRRKVLLGLSIAIAAAVAVTDVVGIVMTSGHMNETAGILLFLLFWLCTFGTGIVYAVFFYIALYDLYVSCDPGNGVLYLVLSIVLNVTQPFFVFACRKKDLGMPRRKEPQPVAPVIPEPAEAEAPAEVEAPIEEAPAEVPAGEDSPENDPVPEENSGEAPGEE